jgi:hypothetical protein
MNKQPTKQEGTFKERTLVSTRMNEEGTFYLYSDGSVVKELRDVKHKFSFINIIDDYM